MSKATDAQTNHHDLLHIEWGKRHSVLKEINGESYRNRIQIGTQSACCSDSDQFFDIRRHHHRIIEHPNQRYGWLNLYGGAALIPHHSPLARHGQGNVLLHELYLGHVMGKGETMFYGHAPCGKIRLRHLSVRDSYKLLADAPVASKCFFRQQAENIQRYTEAVASLQHTRNHTPTNEEIMVYAELSFEEITTIEEVANIMPLAQAVALTIPVFLTQYQVDYGKLGGESDKRRTYEFDCDAFRSAMRDEQMSQELDMIA